MCDPIGWVPRMPRGMEMPPGYDLNAEKGMDGGRAVYYWSFDIPDDDDDLIGYNVECGDYTYDKRQAVRQAWADFRNRELLKLLTPPDA